MTDIFWQNRKQSRMKEYWCDHQHRRLILNELKKIEFDSLLEIGCACGYNLKLINDVFPHITSSGIDINLHAVEYGREKGVDIALCSIEEIHHSFLPNSVDVILSDASLMYVHPRDIKKVICHLATIAKKQLIFCEFFSKNKLGENRFGQWERNYPKLLLDIGLKCEKIKITKDIWPETNWSTIGYLFITKL